MIERGDDDCGEIGEGEDPAEGDLAGCFEGEKSDGQEVDVVILSESAGVSMGGQSCQRGGSGAREKARAVCRRERELGSFGMLKWSKWVEDTRSGPGIVAPTQRASSCFQS